MEVQKSSAQAFSSQTNKAYNTLVLYLVRWVFFMGYVNCLRDPMLFAQVALGRYVEFMAQTRTYGSVVTAMNGVRLFFIERGMSNPLANNYKYYKHMRGLRRRKGDIAKGKFPITATQLCWLAQACDTNDPYQVAFTVAALVAFFGFLRKSNVTTGRTHNEDITHAILMGDISIDEPSYSLMVTLRCTKTIQFGERTVQIPIKGIRGSIIDPVAWWRLHLRCSGGGKEGKAHAFAYKKGKSWANLTHTAFVKRLKDILSANGIDSSQYAAHSFRRGGATAARSCSGSEPGSY
jgi:hypothetical protein